MCLELYKHEETIGQEMEVIGVDINGTITVLGYEFLLYAYWSSGIELQTEVLIVTGLIPEILAAQINN